MIKEINKIIGKIMMMDKDSEVNYVVIPSIVVFDYNQNMINHLNKLYKDNGIPLYAIRKGQSVIGLKFGLSRPKVIIMLCDILNEKEEAWEKELYLAMDVNGIVFKNHNHYFVKDVIGRLNK